MIIELKHEWATGVQIGSGGFGKVYEATSDLPGKFVAKLVPKEVGASREQLFVEIEDGVNIIPVIESGEYKKYWVLIMPRAEKSLMDLMNSNDLINTDLAIDILSDISEALTSIDGKVVHRDIKPENILFLDGKWCLADFGISRYAEASTAPDTQKFAWSAPYAGPERWRSEHADIKTDVYSFGIIGYELLSGKAPFVGPSREDYREQHLHQTPETLAMVNPQLADLIDECLYKPTSTRPQPANIYARLNKIKTSAILIEIPELQEANRSEVARIGEESAARSRARTQLEAREELFQNANTQLVRLSNQLADVIIENAPTAQSSNRVRSSWVINLGKAKMQFSPITREIFPDWEGRSPNFDVVATADITVTSQENQYGYQGRSHSLWFCDYETRNEYGWYEVAFMISPLMGKSSRVEPFSLEPGKDAGGAISTTMSRMQVAVSFKRINSDSSQHLIQWWATYLAKSSLNGCVHPSTIPEPPSSGPWR